jgi:hypothetical protein
MVTFRAEAASRRRRKVWGTDEERAKSAWCASNALPPHPITTRLFWLHGMTTNRLILVDNATLSGVDRLAGESQTLNLNNIDNDISLL